MTRADCDISQLVTIDLLQWPMYSCKSGVYMPLHCELGEPTADRYDSVIHW